MEITARVNLSADNRLQAPVHVGAPSDLDQAKHDHDQDELCKSAVDVGDNLIDRFRKMAGGLAQIDNADLQPEPKEPSLLDRVLHPETLAAYKAAKDKLAAFNGKDLSPQIGHVVTTADLNNNNVNGELIFDPKTADFSSNGQILSPDTTLKADAEGPALTLPTQLGDINIGHVKQSWSLTHAEGKDLYHYSQTNDGEKDIIQTEQWLTVDPSARVADYRELHTSQPNPDYKPTPQGTSK